MVLVCNDDNDVDVGEDGDDDVGNDDDDDDDILACAPSSKGQSTVHEGQDFQSLSSPVQCVQCADKQSQRTRADMLHKKLNIVDGPFVGIWYIIETRRQFSTTNHTQFGVFWVVRGTGMPLGFVTLSFHHIPEV